MSKGHTIISASLVRKMADAIEVGQATSDKQLRESSALRELNTNTYMRAITAMDMSGLRMPDDFVAVDEAVQTELSRRKAQRSWEAQRRKERNQKAREERDYN